MTHAEWMPQTLQKLMLTMDEARKARLEKAAERAASKAQSVPALSPVQTTEFTASFRLTPIPGTTIRIRPSSAALRKELRDPKTPDARRKQVYDWLQYRRQYTGGR
jgi:hypothetical protein